MRIPHPPGPVDWSRGYQLQAEHFVRSDTRTELLAFLAAAVGEPWPWGFFDAVVDETALASGELGIRCAGVFPSGTFFSAVSLVQKLPAPGDVPGGALSFYIESESRDSAPALRPGDAAPSESTMPVARIVSHRGVWSLNSQWSPPALLVGPDHPLRADAAEALAGLAGLAAGFMTTLRMPGAEERAAARRLATVSALLVQGVGVLEAYLASPFVTPGRLGVEARRLALGVRAAAGVFEPLSDPWDPADQRGSLRTILGAAQATASRLGLPFRASVFRVVGDDGRFVAEGLPRGRLSLGVEAARASDLMAARRRRPGRPRQDRGSAQPPSGRVCPGAGSARSADRCLQRSAPCAVPSERRHGLALGLSEPCARCEDTTTRRCVVPHLRSRARRRRRRRSE